MNDNPEKKEILVRELSKEQLFALRWVMRARSKDNQGPLERQGIYVHKGNILATDGYRIHLWTQPDGQEQILPDGNYFIGLLSQKYLIVSVIDPKCVYTKADYFINVLEQEIKEGLVNQLIGSKNLLACGTINGKYLDDACRGFEATEIKMGKSLYLITPKTELVDEGTFAALIMGMHNGSKKLTWGANWLEEAPEMAPEQAGA